MLDFGLVKHFDAVTTLLTLDGMATGTPAYMAPELARGGDAVDGRSDLYSLGCVAYYLLTGHHIFQRKTAISSVLAHLNHEPPRPGSMSEFDVPPALDALILECLAKDPALRPSSAVILSKRLAIASASVWTPEAAHTWWYLHAPNPGPAAHTAFDTSVRNESSLLLPRDAPPARRHQRSRSL